MEPTMMQSLQANAAYVEELYQRYLADPNAVSTDWQAIFAEVTTSTAFAQPTPSPILAAPRLNKTTLNANERPLALQLLQEGYRRYGHYAAKLDPLGLQPQQRFAELTPEHYGLDAEAFIDEIARLEQIYCGTLGADFYHLDNSAERQWLIEQLEQPQTLDRPQQRQLLKELVAAEGLERYLAARYPGAKRFGLEGGEGLLPLLKSLLAEAINAEYAELVLGMAHRGRLNALVNFFGKPSAELFAEFAGEQLSDGTGDVKYHKGYSSDLATPYGQIHLALAFNPSHLEIVNPVVMGSARARQDRRRDPLGLRVLPITLHGDSAFSSQGVVAETFNLSQTRAYQVGGSIRIVINNQIGFTTSKREDLRSSHYCTDGAKAIQAPVLHVNGDDAEALARAAQIAFGYRQTFHKDVVIDLVCYRRNGHNEADEPNATQPLLYQAIRQQPSPRQIYAERLLAQGAITQPELEGWMDSYRAQLDAGGRIGEAWLELPNAERDWAPFLGQDWLAPYSNYLETDRLTRLANQACAIPEGFQLQKQVAKIYQDRALMASGARPFDWGGAEVLAYASLLAEGTPVRLIGQDVGRGTFFHRHAALHEQQSAEVYLPLAHLNPTQGRFTLHDSVLSEEAALAFEYGYAATDPQSLVVWEAQFGDFANGAQAVFDQFLSSGEQKWGRLCGLVVLLPHGYEGQGPEHSSARLERYLQLCAQHNMQVCIPSTPAQMFHLLRRQSLRPLRRPLIVITPKSLLRHPQATSSLHELSEGNYQLVIGDNSLPTDLVEHVVLCAGKIYYELLEGRSKGSEPHLALIRLEQLYPFPTRELRHELARYPRLRSVTWCQEEPKNQGAWHAMRHRLEEALPSGVTLLYAGRAAAAAPAVGNHHLHQQEQEALLQAALNPNL